MADFLLELYSEEIPPKLQINARKQISDSFISLLNKEGISFTQGKWNQGGCGSIAHCEGENGESLIFIITKRNPDILIKFPNLNTAKSDHWSFTILRREKTKFVNGKSKLTYLYAMGLPKQLSEQQKKFAELLVYNEGRKTPTECAIEAGYAEGSAHVRASELRNPNKFPLVAKYIGEIRQEVQKKYEVNFEKHITELGRIREAALSKGAFSLQI